MKLLQLWQSVSFHFRCRESRCIFPTIQTSTDGCRNSNRTIFNFGRSENRDCINMWSPFSTSLYFRNWFSRFLSLLCNVRKYHIILQLLPVIGFWVFTQNLDWFLCVSCDWDYFCGLNLTRDEFCKVIRIRELIAVYVAGWILLIIASRTHILCWIMQGVPNQAISISPSPKKGNLRGVSIQS